MNKTTLLNIGLATLLIALFVMNNLAHNNVQRRSVMLFNDMVYSEAYASHESNPNYANGMNLQIPPDGTIARGQMPLHYEATEEGAVKAAMELTSPFEAGDAKILKEGTVLYASFCLPCHGASGAGDGLVVKYGFPPPPSLLADNAKTIKDGRVFHIISHGRGNMPGHAAQLLPEERWKIIAYIRSLQSNQ